jgi:exodeoxyribonuclease VII large subunit
VLTDPARPVRDLERRLDELTARLGAGLTGARREARHRAILATNSLLSHNPLARISNVAQLLDQVGGRLQSGVARRMERAQDSLRTAMGQLDSLSPLAVLRRGYSLTRLPSGEIVRSGRQVAPGSLVLVLLHEGTLGARVTEVKERDDRPQV